MATTIAPSLGSAPLYTQQGVGASPGYAAIDRRRASAIGLQEGVLAAQSYEVTQRGAGANMSVDVAATTIDALGSGVAAVVQGDSVSGQGLYPVPGHASVINEAVTAAHATLPRIDMVVLEVLDNIHDSSGSNLARVRIVNGTATSGATLDNRTGAAALPSSCLLLADILVAGAASSITNAVIRDRRRWARGAEYSVIITAGDYTVTTSIAALDTTRLKKRIECSGVPIRIRLNAPVQTGAGTNQVALFLYVDGVSVFQYSVQTNALSVGQDISVPYTPFAGSHVFEWRAQTNTGTGAVLANAFSQAIFEIEEILRQNTANNSTTTG